MFQGPGTLLTKPFFISFCDKISMKNNKSIRALWIDNVWIPREKQVWMQHNAVHSWFIRLTVNKYCWIVISKKSIISLILKPWIFLLTHRRLRRLWQRTQKTESKTQKFVVFVVMLPKAFISVRFLAIRAKHSLGLNFTNQIHKS